MALPTPNNDLKFDLTCPICKKESCLSCAACKKVYYCSREHQKLDWKRHKPECFPSTLAYDPMIGRHLIATRDIEAGEFVLKEMPLTSGPLGRPECFPVCLTCFKRVKTNYVCNLCEWPMCGPKCEQDSKHADFECRLFRNRVAPINQSEVAFYEKIIVLRGVMLKKRDPARWAKIQSLETHKEMRAKEHNSRVLTQTCVAFIRVACGLKDVTDDEIDQVLGAVIVNGFISDDSVTAGDLFRSGSYLYFYASMPAHDCRPNSSWVIQSNTEFMIRAATPIKAGEAILHLYTQPTFGTQHRRQYLKESKYFDCTCVRCKDPTELGTYFSAVKCPVCGPGYLLLDDPTVDESMWKCDSCEKKIPQLFVDDVLNRVTNNEFMQDPELQKDSMKSIQLLEKVLKLHKGKTVHENHYAIHSIENDLIQRMSFILSTPDSKLSENERAELADKMTDVTKRVIAVADVTWPGINRHQGRLLYFLQQCLMVSLARKVDVESKRPKPNDDQLANMRSALEEVVALRQKVHKILSIEPEGREERFIADLMTSDTEELRRARKFLKV